MKQSEDRDIVFHPQQGLVGKVFCHQHACGAITREAGNGRRIDWDPVHVESGPGSEDGKFVLSPEQQDLLGVNPKWIIGFPLKIQDGDIQSTVGVLNIDGVQHFIDCETLKRLFIDTARKAFEISAKFSDISKKRLVITTEEVSDGKSN
jgi:hypothetical protein